MYSPSTTYPAYAHGSYTRYYTGLQDGTTENQRMWYSHYRYMYLYFKSQSINSGYYTRYYWNTYAEGQSYSLHWKTS